MSDEALKKKQQGALHTSYITTDAVRQDLSSMFELFFNTLLLLLDGC